MGPCTGSLSWACPRNEFLKPTSVLPRLTYSRGGTRGSIARAAAPVEPTSMPWKHCMGSPNWACSRCAFVEPTSTLTMPLHGQGMTHGGIALAALVKHAHAVLPWRAPLC